MAAGLAPSDFWEATPREIAAILKGAADRERRWLRIWQGIAYSLAQLISHSFHQPKKMPKFDKVFPDPSARPRGPQTADQMLAMMRAFAGRKKG